MIKIGDKLKWGTDPNTTYVVLDINYQRSLEILFQWWDGICLKSDWYGSVNMVNALIEEGDVEIVGEAMNPINMVRKFYFV